MAITPTALHDALTQAAEALRSQRIEGLFDSTPDRTSGYRCEAAGLTLDYSKHLLDDNAWQTLLTVSDTQALPAAFASLIGGEIVNTSEHRPALHIGKQYSVCCHIVGHRKVYLIAVSSYQLWL